MPSNQFLENIVLTSTIFHPKGLEHFFEKNILKYILIKIHLFLIVLFRLTFLEQLFLKIHHLLFRMRFSMLQKVLENIYTLRIPDFWSECP